MPAKPKKKSKKKPKVEPELAEVPKLELEPIAVIEEVDYFEPEIEEEKPQKIAQ